MSDNLVYIGLRKSVLGKYMVKPCQLISTDEKGMLWKAWYILVYDKRLKT